MKKKKGCRWIIPAIMLAGITLAVSIMIYPEFMDSVNAVTQTINIGVYARDTMNLSDEKLQETMQAAKEYNRDLFEQQREHPFVYMGQDAESEEYRQLLRISPDDQIMAFIEIPGIGVYLPVTHGTHSEDLRYQAGHMYGTSLPVGGTDTHACLTAHTGLETADLFTGVSRLQTGDTVMIHVLGEIHTYAVCEINICEPLEFSDYLQIEEGRDLITLFTCTPYGINSHRLLVKCERTGDIEKDRSQGEIADVKVRNMKAALEASGWLLIPVILQAAGIVIITRTGRKGTVK